MLYYFLIFITIMDFLKISEFFFFKKNCFNYQKLLFLLYSLKNITILFKTINYCKIFKLQIIIK